MAETAPAVPTAEEARWAAATLNSRRYGREVTTDDMAKAAEIMARRRRAAGRLGGGQTHRRSRKSNPLETARHIDVLLNDKVAEAQGINDAREGAVVPPPEEAPPAPAPEPAPEPISAPLLTIPKAEETFRDAGAVLLEQIEAEVGRVRQARHDAAALAAAYEDQLDRLERRQEAILGALRDLATAPLGEPSDG